MRKSCEVCGVSFEGHHTAKYCGGACRKRAQRRPGGVNGSRSVTGADSEPDGPVTAAVLKELAEAKRAGTALGEAALALARRIDGAARESGASLASLSKELRATLGAALADAAPAADPVDELRARRDGKRHAG